MYKIPLTSMITHHRQNLLAELRWCCFTFHIKVEEEIRLCSNAGHVIDEVGQGDVVLEYIIQW